MAYAEPGYENQGDGIVMYPQSIRENFENYRILLKQFPHYSAANPRWAWSFSYTNIAADQSLQALKKTYRLDSLTRNGNGLETCLKAMEWTFYRLLHRDSREFYGPFNALGILDFSIANRVTVNCLCHATVLTEVLLALGFKARMVSCLPVDLDPMDNHVVTTVYIPGLNKWVMLDPALCCYITNQDGIILSIPEIRQDFIDDAPLEICVGGRFRNLKAPDSVSSSFDKTEYRAYLHKNFFRFMSAERPGPVRDGAVFYVLVPAGFLEPNTEQTVTNKGGAQIHRITNNADFFWYGEAEEE
jgi:hypothetical protein